MGRRAKNSTVEVAEGLYLKSQPNTVNLQAYCRINSQTFRKSVGTDNVAKAKSIALDWYYDLKQQAKKGLLLKKTSFHYLPMKLKVMRAARKSAIQRIGGFLLVCK